jgi:hypothetical protein
VGFNALSEMKDLCDFIYTGFVDMPSILVTYHIWQERHTSTIYYYFTTIQTSLSALLYFSIVGIIHLL